MKYKIAAIIVFAFALCQAKSQEYDLDSLRRELNIKKQEYEYLKTKRVEQSDELKDLLRRIENVASTREKLPDYYDSLKAATEVGDAYSVGTDLKYSFIMHNAAFRKMSGVPTCCPNNYDERTGSLFGLSFAGFYEYVYSEKTSFGFRVAIEDLSGDFQRKELIYYSDDGIATPAEALYEFNADLSAINFSPYLNYYPMENVYVSAGLNIGMFSSAAFSQKEILPAGIGFTYKVNGESKSCRNEFVDEEIPDLNSFQYGGRISAGYEIPFSRMNEFTIAPEISYNFNFGDVADLPEGQSWSVGSFGGGIAFRWSPKGRVSNKDKYFYNLFQDDSAKYHELYFELREEKDEMEKRLDLRQTEYVIVGNAIKTLEEQIDFWDKRFEVRIPKITGVRVADGEEEEINDEKIVISKYEQKRLIPLLPYIFFDVGERKLPERYVQLDSKYRNDFDVRKLKYQNDLQFYYNILNVVGKRMSQNPGLTITLTAYPFAGDSTEAEKNAEKRLRSINKYMQRTWKMQSSRVTTQIASEPLPQALRGNASDYPVVEIKSNSPEALAPVVIEVEDYNEMKYSAINAYPVIKTGKKILNWSFRYDDNYGADSIASGDGGTLPPEKFHYDFNENPMLVPQYQTSLVFYLHARNEEKEIKNIEEMIDVEVEKKTQTVLKISALLLPEEDIEYGGEFIEKYFNLGDYKLLKARFRGFDSNSDLANARSRAEKLKNIMNIKNGAIIESKNITKYGSEFPEEIIYGDGAEAIIYIDEEQ